MKYNTPLSIIVPVYNEAATIVAVIAELKSYSREHLTTYEIIVINDGSRDDTGKILDGIDGITVAGHVNNRGYGASLKNGIQRSQYEWVLFYDGDGQFPSGEISKLLPFVSDYDMIVGERNASSTPFVRRPGKWVLHAIANFFSRRKSPDLNSGFRIIRKEYILPFWHLLPATFSITTTLTLLFQQSDLTLKYVPVVLRPRAGGKSTVGVSQAFRMFMLILRTIILFSPLRVFLPSALGIFCIGLVSLVYDISNVHITNTTVLLFMSALLVFFFGLVSDQIANLRIESSAQRIHKDEDSGTQ